MFDLIKIMFEILNPCRHSPWLEALAKFFMKLENQTPPSVKRFFDCWGRLHPSGVGDWGSVLTRGQQSDQPG